MRCGTIRHHQRQRLSHFSTCGTNSHLRRGARAGRACVRADVREPTLIRTEFPPNSIVLLTHDYLSLAIPGHHQRQRLSRFSTCDTDSYVRRGARAGWACVRAKVRKPVLIRIECCPIQ